ncbi:MULTISPECIES: superinfection immunity protein [Legionella]|uniref:superinfection immunity protein n=1 Tax=Legionella TaxID=445 RepID=UPI0010417202
MTTSNWLGTEIIYILLFVLSILLIPILYFLPALIASKRNHQLANSIAVVNLFFGWTLLGWVLSLA